MRNEVIKCEHPVILQNPNLPILVRSGFDQIVMNGQVKNVDKSYIVVDENGNERLRNLSLFSHYELSLSSYGDYPTVIDDKQYYYTLPKEVRRLYYQCYTLENVEDIQNYYIVNTSDGVVEPLFVVVPCGRCSLCRKKRVDINAFRCLLEQVSHKRPPFFVTLTFNPLFYCQLSTELSNQTRILQLFHKRLRKALYKAGIPTDFKYFAVSEFGSKNGRLHYHVIYYGLDERLYMVADNHCESSNYKYVTQFSNYVYDSWKLGFVDVQVDNGKSKMYVQKYIMKHTGEASTKYWKSIHLGRETIKKYSDDICRRYKEKDFMVEDYFGSPKKIPMYAFIKREIFPSLTRVLSLNIRRQLQENYFIIQYFNLCRNGRNPLLFKYYCKYSNIARALGYTEIKESNYVLTAFYSTLKEIDLIELVLCNFHDINMALKGSDLEDMLKKHIMYHESLLITNDIEFDVEMLAYNVDTSFGDMVSREIDNQ